VFLTRPESKSEVFLSLLEVPSKLKIIHLKHPCYISTVVGYCQEKRITLRILQGVVTLRYSGWFDVVREEGLARFLSSLTTKEVAF